MSDCIKGKAHDFESSEFSNYCANGCGETWSNYTIKQLGARVKELEEREKKLIECVRFYADKENWDCEHSREFCEIIYFLLKDNNGELARQTLKELTSEG